MAERTTACTHESWYLRLNYRHGAKLRWIRFARCSHDNDSFRAKRKTKRGINHAILCTNYYEISNMCEKISNDEFSNQSIYHKDNRCCSNIDQDEREEEFTTSKISLKINLIMLWLSHNCYYCSAWRGNAAYS